MLNTPFAPWPSYTSAEAAAVQRVLLSNKVNYWTGNEGRAFETEFAAWADCQHAVAVANGTLALELALRALEIGPGDEVIVAPRTFLASASAIVALGATPIFADVDAQSQTLCVESVAARLTAKTKAIICVHLAGWPCDMAGLMALSEQHGVKIIEDCAQAHGARYKGRSVGSIGHIGAWSFCQDKIMTTGGEGGMVTTQDAQLWSKMWSYKDHGKSWEAVYQQQHPPGFRWLHDSFGSNLRMTEMQAAIGRIQLQAMPQWHAARTKNAQKILSMLTGVVGLKLPVIPAHCEHAWYKCYVFIERETLKRDWDRDSVMAEINRRGVPCYTGSCSEIYREKAFATTPWRPSHSLPVAHMLGEESLMLLVHPTLTDAQIEATGCVVKSVMEEAVAL